MRCFVAVWPPPDVVAALAALPRPDVAGLRWTTVEQWHVTLRFLGNVDEAAARRAFATIDAGTAPVAVELGPATGRFGRRVLHVPASGVDRLAGATLAATAGVGVPPERRRFAGHVTLARARERSGVDLRPLVGTPFAASWTASELTLVASHLGAGPGGAARYEVLASLPLGGA